MFDTAAYYGQPGAIAQQFGTQNPFQSPLGTLPTQYAQQLAAQALAASLASQGPFGNPLAQHGQPFGQWPGQQQLGLPPQALIAALAGQYAHPQLGTGIGGWGALQHPLAMGQQPLFGAPHGVPQFGQGIGGWPGQQPLAGLMPQAILGALVAQCAQQQLLGHTIGAQSPFGFAGQPPFAGQSPFGGIGRGVPPYQSVPQMAFAG